MPRWATVHVNTGIIVRIIEMDEQPSFDMGERVVEVGSDAKIGETIDTAGKLKGS